LPGLTQVPAAWTGRCRGLHRGGNASPESRWFVAAFGVGVALVSAGGALEGRLARAACRVHVPAPVARLGRVRGLTKTIRLPVRRATLAEGQFQLVPALVENRAVEPPPVR
jgi:hypothetical protein